MTNDAGKSNNLSTQKKGNWVWKFKDKDKVNKIDERLAKLTKGKKKRRQITNTGNKRGDITADPTHIKGQENITTTP